ncbi:MAG: M48 family metalloprotease [Bryobacteraceae bacterium]
MSISTVKNVLIPSFMLTIGASLLISPGWAAQGGAALPPARNFQEFMDRTIQSEHRLMESLKSKTPIVETYIQEMKNDSDFGKIPGRDFYFLGKLNLTNGVDDASMIPAGNLFTTKLRTVAGPLAPWNEFFPRGFASRMFIDHEFDRSHYVFEYEKREFLGDVRCFVVNVWPRKGAGNRRFEGRIWVNDRDYTVVRFSGTYGQMHKGFMHFDSWRVNAGPHMWLPAYVYTEEGSYSSGLLKTAMVKAQTRIWRYETQKDEAEETFTNLTVDMQQGIKDQSDGAAETSPLQAQRLWQRQAEDNVIERLQRVGLISPAGEVDKVLETVVNNLEVSANVDVDPPVRVRVMPTTPLESVAVGHTIVISRGLIDVLPDEASLAAVLAQELSHILLGHSVDTEYAFADRLWFADNTLLSGVSLARTHEEEVAADAKAIEILKKSPYKDKLPKVGIFLRMLSARSDELPHLIRPLLGNRMADTHQDLRLSGLMDAAPELEMTSKDQIAALPLGSRVKMDPWSSRVFLMKTQNVQLLSAKDKLPFEITPFMPHLTWEEEGPGATAGTADMSANRSGERR